MGRTDKYKEKPKVHMAEIRPAESRKTTDHNKNVKEKAPYVLELERMDPVELKNEIPDKMG